MNIEVLELAKHIESLTKIDKKELFVLLDDTIIKGGYIHESDYTELSETYDELELELENKINEFRDRIRELTYVIEDLEKKLKDIRRKIAIQSKP